MTQLQAWWEMMAHGEFLAALAITILVGIAYGLLAQFVLWPLWSGAWDYVERRLR